MRRILAALALSAFASASSAGGSAEAVVEKWYAALKAVDRSAFEQIIADDAVITLNDLETDQTKLEFLESLDEWQDAVRDASIRHRIETASADSAIVLVCYTFPGNEALGREIFRVSDGKIKQSVQTSISDSCAEF